MKKTFLLLLSFLALLPIALHSQGGLGGNTNFGANFLGFNAGLNGPLQTPAPKDLKSFGIIF